jgi:hypothetical protein
MNVCNPVFDGLFPHGHGSTSILEWASLGWIPAVDPVFWALLALVCATMVTRRSRSRSRPLMVRAFGPARLKRTPRRGSAAGKTPHRRRVRRCDVDRFYLELTRDL